MKEKQRLSDIDKYRIELQNLGLYHPRNERLMKLIVMMEKKVQRMNAESLKYPEIMKTVGYNGQDKITDNPINDKMFKAVSTLGRLLAYMGHGNKPVEAELNKEEKSLLDEVMNQ